MKREQNPKRLHYLGLGGVLILSLFGFVIANVAFPDESSLPHRICFSLAEALLIAVVIGFFVEPYMRKRFVQEVSGDSVWAFINPLAPAKYKEQLGRIAAQQVLLHSTEWVVTFDLIDGDPDHLRIGLSSRSLGRNLGPRQYEFTGKTWVLASSDDYNSEYLYQALAILDDETPVSRRFERHQLVDLVEIDHSGNDGTLFLDRAKLWDGLSLAPSQSFLLEAKTRMFRHFNGYVPLVNSVSSLETKITVQGTALSQLVVRIFAPGGTEFRASRLSGPQTWKAEGVVFPLQMFILSWKPADDERPGLTTVVRDDQGVDVIPDSTSAADPNATAG